jgi:Fe-S cluster assembly protein SufD
MTALAEQHSRFIESFERLRPRLGDGHWLAPVRRAAMDRFTELGFPTTDHEDWRFTNVAPIAATAFAPAKTPSVLPSASDLRPFTFGEPCRLVFVNGHYCPALSLTPSVAGLKIASIGESLKSDGPDSQSQLAKHARYDDQAFVALNTAMFEDGASVQIAPNAIIPGPIHLLYVFVPDEQPSVAYPRNLIVAGLGSQATVVESYIGLSDGVYLSNAVTELVLGENAVVDHYHVQRESPKAFHVSTLHLQQDRSSTVSSLSVSLGGSLTRNDIVAVLGGEGGDCTLNGLFMGEDKQHVDNHLRVEHVAPHCHSWEYYKGVLDGQAKGVFTGRIVVHKGAQKTDAKQTNMNLLLSEGAQIDTKPQLEIFADDVKCTHGATIGQIDADALFYLRARGISELDARNLMVYAFAGESLGQIKIDSLRRELEALLFDRLPGGERLKEAL